MMRISGKTAMLPALRRASQGALVLAAVAAVAAVALSGCSTLQPAAGTGTSSSGSAREYRQAIDVSGRLSLRYQQDGKQQAVYGSFTWSQSRQETAITLLSPLGQTLATINIGAGQATLQQAGQPPRIASDVDALTVQALGWPLPIAGLRDWLQGFGEDAGGRRFTAIPNADDSFSVTTADQWQIQYSNWQESGAESYPKRIDLTRNTAQAGEVAIRIAISSRQSH